MWWDTATGSRRIWLSGGAVPGSRCGCSEVLERLCEIDFRTVPRTRLVTARDLPHPTL